MINLCDNQYNYQKYTLKDWLQYIEPMVLKQCHDRIKVLHHTVNGDFTFRDLSVKYVFLDFAGSLVYRTVAVSTHGTYGRGSLVLFLSIVLMVYSLNQCI